MSVLFKSKDELDSQNNIEILVNLKEEGLIDSHEYKNLINEIKKNSFQDELETLLDDNFKKNSIVFKRNDYFNQLIDKFKTIKNKEYKYLDVPIVSTQSGSSSPFKLESKKISFFIEKEEHCSKFFRPNCYEEDKAKRFLMKILKYSTDKVFIVGKPGVGKTVHYYQLTYSWATDEWEDARDKIIFNISVSKISDYEDIYSTILEQNFKDFPLITKEFIRQIFSQKNQSIILLIDGFDEWKEDKFTFKDFLKQLTSYVTIVIWSRYSYEIPIKFRNYRTYRLLGTKAKELEKALLECYKNEESSVEQFIDHIKKLNVTDICFGKRVYLDPFFGFYCYALYREKKIKPDIQSIFNVYPEFIQQNLKNKHWLQMEIADKFCQLCLENLHTAPIETDLPTKEINEIKENIGGILRITHSNDSSIIIEFYDEKFKECLVALFIIKKFKISYPKKDLEKLISKIPDRSINWILNFIKNEDCSVFKEILKKSKILKEYFKFDKETENLIFPKYSLEIINLMNILCYHPFIFEFLLEQNENLQTLTVCYKEEISDILLNFINHSFKNLKCLSINLPDKISSESIFKNFFLDLIELFYKNKFQELRVNNKKFLWKNDKFMISENNEEINFSRREVSSKYNYILRKIFTDVFSFSIEFLGNFFLKFH